MHGIVGYIIIGGCVVVPLVAVASFVIDMRQSQRGAEKRRRLSSRLTGK